MTEKIILLASHNKGKVKEFNELLSPYGFKAVPADELGIWRKLKKQHLILEVIH